MVGLRTHDGVGTLNFHVVFNIFKPCVFFASFTTLLLLTLVSNNVCLAKCGIGWFGNKCAYQCHCAGDAVCDEIDGACPGKCDAAWFGPACQYSSSKFKATDESKFAWLEDNNDETCNYDRSSATVTVELLTSVPLTWVRIVVNNPAQLDQFRLAFQTKSRRAVQHPCRYAQTAKWNSNSADITCKTDETVAYLTVSGPGVSALCSLYISGETVCPAARFGRECEQDCNCFNATEDCFVSTGGCVSGCAPGFTGEDCGTACDFRQYGSGCGENCSSHCAGNDKACDAVDGSCIEGCEPGYESPFCKQGCTIGKYGPGCRETCSTHCVGSTNACHHVSGHCDHGCNPGYEGLLCQHVCPSGRYGPGCTETCSIHCAGPGNTCSPLDGSCDQGCDPGYEEPLCKNAPASSHTGIIWIISGAVAAAVFVTINVVVFVIWRRLRSGRQDSKFLPPHEPENGIVARVANVPQRQEADGDYSSIGAARTGVPLPDTPRDNYSVLQRSEGDGGIEHIYIEDLDNPQDNYDALDRPEGDDGNEHVYGEDINPYDHPNDSTARRKHTVTGQNPLKRTDDAPDGDEHPGYVQLFDDCSHPATTNSTDGYVIMGMEMSSQATKDKDSEQPTYINGDVMVGDNIDV